jgi:DNA-binding MarR family transcriptional regulator
MRMQTRPVASIETVDTSFLEGLVGYNARRATLVVVEAFLKKMAQYDLRPSEFSVLSLIAHNPGITSSQLCSALNIRRPNLVGMVSTFEKRKLLQRLPHPRDGRAQGLHLTPAGQSMMQKAERTASRVEESSTACLTAPERKTLMLLLKKIYT